MSERNREGWITDAIERERMLFAGTGCQSIPHKIKGSCSWPSSGGRSMKKRTIGECWGAERSKGGTTEIFVSPTLDQPLAVLETLAHELIHASGISGHKADFQAAMKAIGLEGKPTATKAGNRLASMLKAIADELGPYPHDELTVPEPTKKGGTRQLPIECPDCGTRLRGSAEALKGNGHGLPYCSCKLDPAMEPYLTRFSFNVTKKTQKKKSETEDPIEVE